MRGARSGVQWLLLYVCSKCAAEIIILEPQDGATVHSPFLVRVSVDVESMDLALQSFVLQNLSHWELCMTVSDHEDSGSNKPTYCAGLQNGKQLDLVSVTRGKQHTVTAYLRAQDGDSVSGYPLEDVHRRWESTSISVFASSEVALCGPSSTELGSTSSWKTTTLLPPLSGGVDGAANGGAVELPEAAWLQHRAEGFSTHQPLLVHHVRAAVGSGDIWEFGAGTGSTPLLRTLASLSGRVLITVEDSAECLDRIRATMPPTDYHRYEYSNPNNVTDKDTGATASWSRGLHWLAYLRQLNLPEGYEASVVFIDQVGNGACGFLCGSLFILIFLVFML
jgi:hypothetical protein